MRADKPWNQTPAVTTPDGSHDIKTFQPDAQGRFNVTLDLGAYAIHRPAASSASTPPTRSNVDAIVVSRDHWTLANVSCDTGIR